MTLASRKEIERKFLVERAPADLETYPSAKIEQGYVAITSDAVEVRIRPLRRAGVVDDQVRRRARLEEEIGIDERRFRALRPLTEDRRIQKTRYRIPASNGLTIES